MRELTAAESTKTCLVCDVPLSSLQRHQRVVLCGARCRGAYSRLLPGQVCVYCGRPLKNEGLAGGLCVGKDCRLRFAERQTREREERERQAREDVARRIHEAAVSSEQSGQFPLAIIPANPLQIVPVDPERKQLLRDHIECVLGELTLGDPKEPPPYALKHVVRSEAMLNVLGNACSLCGGDCCRRGANRAYLDVHTFRRYLDQHPEAGPADVVAAYLGKVGETGYAGSCIYHRPDGCALPREMRSLTCNQYFCDELKAFERDADGTEPRGFFVAGRAGAVRAAGFVDDDGVRTVPVQVEPP